LLVILFFIAVLHIKSLFKSKVRVMCSVSHEPQGPLLVSVKNESRLVRVFCMVGIMVS